MQEVQADEGIAMEAYYITFGQEHTHRVNGATFDCDCVAVIMAVDELNARGQAFLYFDGKWHHCTSEVPKMEYYPRGLLHVDPRLRG